jgi:hypothetical protein
MFTDSPSDAAGYVGAHRNQFSIQKTVCLDEPEKGLTQTLWYRPRLAVHENSNVTR